MASLPRAISRLSYNTLFSSISSRCVSNQFPHSSLSFPTPFYTLNRQFYLDGKFDKGNVGKSKSKEFIVKSKEQRLKERAKKEAIRAAKKERKRTIIEMNQEGKETHVITSNSGPNSSIIPAKDDIAGIHDKTIIHPTLLTPTSAYPYPLSFSNLPVITHHVPRTYPFPIILTTELILEEDIETSHVRPHDIPPYKSTLTVHLNDLPLTPLEKKIFRTLVGPRIYTKSLYPHPLPDFLRENYLERRKSHSAEKAKYPYRVKFVCRHLQSAQANENRVFQLLDACIYESKKLAIEMMNDGEWIEESEEEEILRIEKDKMEKRKYQQRQKKREQADKQLNSPAPNNPTPPPQHQMAVGRAS